MRVEALELVAFGPFSGTVLEFGGPGSVDVVFGPNEAGKSACLRAWVDLFCGFGTQTPDAFLHGNRKLRVGARVARRGGGDPLHFVRRKGTKNTLLDASGNPIDDGALAPFLGGIGRDVFVSLGVIGRAELESGRRDLLAGRGHVGAALFSAGLGGAGVSGVAEELEARARELFVPRGKGQVINSLLRELEAARRAQRESELRPGDWAAAREAMAGSEAEADRQEAALQEARAGLERLRRHASVLPFAARYRELREKSGVDAAGLDGTFGDRVRAAEEGWREACTKRDHARAEVNHLEREADAHPALPDGDVDAGAESGAEAGPGPAPDAEANLRALADRSGGLEATAAEAVKRVAELERAADALRREVGSHPGAGDRGEGGAPAAPEVLEALLGEAAGDPEEASRQLEAEAGRLRARVRQATSRLVEWSGTAGELAASPVPSAETVARFSREFDEIERRAQEFTRARDRLGEQAAELRAQLADLESAGAIPSEGDVAAARRSRDESWRALGDRWRGGAEADPGQLDEFAGLVEAADAAADALWREAGRVTQAASLRARAEEAARERERINAGADELAGRRVEFERAWMKAWDGVPLRELLPPKEMGGWLAERERLIERCDGLADAESRAAAAAERVQRLRASLQEALGPAAPGGGSPLAALAALASAELAATRALAEARRRLAGREADLEAAREAQAEATAELDRWRGAWESALRGAGLREGTGVAEARAVLEGRATGRAAAEKVRKSLQRAAGILERATAEVEAFDRVRETLSAEAGRVELASLPAVAELADLRLKLAAAAAGGDVEGFADSVAGLDSDQLKAEIATREGTLQQLETESRDANERFLEARNRFRQLDGRDDAAAHAAEASAIEARLQDAAEEWLRLRVARAMLATGVERYREAHQAAVLKRGGELFARLTCGSFEGIAVDYDQGDEPVLAGLRPTGDRVLPDGLSEGTADQLYLALRLAALEEHLDAAEPLPLVIDDLFVTFDDVRSRAVLEVLGELAERTQVVVFTHHRHLVELAGSVLGEKRLHLAPLPQR